MLWLVAVIVELCLGTMKGPRVIRLGIMKEICALYVYLYKHVMCFMDCTPTVR